MALPTATDLKTMGFSFGAEPLINFASKFGVLIDDMAVSFHAEPFYALDAAGGVAPGGTPVVVISINNY